MSSIGEAKQHIAAGSEAGDEAKQALTSANKAIGEATDLFAAAVEGSTHAQIEQVVSAYFSALTQFETAIDRLTGGQRDANSYAAILG